MHLVRTIRDGVVDADVSVSTTLRKAKILASSLSNNEVRTWVDRELGGYHKGAELPSYRQLKSPVLGDFTARFIGNLKGRQLPTSLMPESVKGMADSLRIGNAVREIETLISTSKGDMRFTWPTEALILMQGHTGVNPEFEATEIYQPITKAQLEGVLDAVRNRLLDFILCLQEIDSNVLHSEEALSRIPQEEVSHVFNVTIYGSHNVLASGTGLTQKVSQHLFPRSKKDLQAYLATLGVAEDDLNSLNEAIDADGPPADHRLGPRVKAWLGRVLAKAVDGTWKTAVSAAPTLLTKAISSYYGWDK